jgi:hypothetical protein
VAVHVFESPHSRAAVCVQRTAWCFVPVYVLKEAMHKLIVAAHVRTHLTPVKRVLACELLLNFAAAGGCLAQDAAIIQEPASGHDSAAGLRRSRGQAADAAASAATSRHRSHG